MASRWWFCLVNTPVVLWGLPTTLHYIQYLVNISTKHEMSSWGLYRTHYNILLICSPIPTNGDGILDTQHNFWVYQRENRILGMKFLKTVVQSSTTLYILHISTVPRLTATWQYTEAYITPCIQYNTDLMQGPHQPHQTSKQYEVELADSVYILIIQ